MVEVAKAVITNEGKHAPSEHSTFCAIQPLIDILHPRLSAHTSRINALV